MPEVLHHPTRRARVLLRVCNAASGVRFARLVGIERREVSLQLRPPEGRVAVVVYDLANEVAVRAVQALANEPSTSHTCRAESSRERALRTTVRPSCRTVFTRSLGRAASTAGPYQTSKVRRLPARDGAMPCAMRRARRRSRADIRARRTSSGRRRSVVPGRRSADRRRERSNGVGRETGSALSCALDHRGRHVDADDLEPTGSKLRGVPACPAAEIEYLLPTEELPYFAKTCCSRSHSAL